MTPPKPPTQNTLMPCPFCGGVAIHDVAGFGEYRNTCCDNMKCKLSEVPFTDEEWNTRAGLSPPKSGISDDSPKDYCAEVVTNEVIDKLKLMAKQKTIAECKEHYGDDEWEGDTEYAYDWFCIQSRKLLALLEKNRVGG